MKSGLDNTYPSNVKCLFTLQKEGISVICNVPFRRETRVVIRLIWPYISNAALSDIREIRLRSSILQQPARDRVATSAKPVPE